MAKKKSKKNTQKQVEAVSPPEASKTVPTTTEPIATEASVESEAQPIAPPTEVDSEQAPIGGPTSVPDPPIGNAQDKHEPLESSTTTAEADIPQPEILPEPEAELQDSIAEPKESTIADETVQPLSEETAEAPASEETTEAALSQSIDPTTPDLSEDVAIDLAAAPIVEPEQTLEPESLPDPGTDIDPISSKDIEVDVAQPEQDLPTITSQLPSIPIVTEDPPLDAVMGTAQSEQSPEALAATRRDSGTTETEIPPAVEAPEVPEVFEVPEEPEVLHAPVTPVLEDIPKAADPELSEAPAADAVSEAPEAPEDVEAPEVPEAPAISHIVEPTEAPEVPQSPELPEVQGATEVAEVPTAPLAEDSSDAHPDAAFHETADVTIDTKTDEEAPRELPEESILPSDVPPLEVEDAELAPGRQAELAPESSTVPGSPVAAAEVISLAPEPPVEREEEVLAPSVPETQELTRETSEVGVQSASRIPVATKKETPKQRRKREAEERKLREEQERLEQEKFDQERIQHERDEMRRLEEELQAKLREERLEKERLAREQAEKDRLKRERLVLERVEKERLEKEEAQQRRLQQEKEELEEQERIEREVKERRRLKREAIAALEVEAEKRRSDQAAEEARLQEEEAQAAAKAQAEAEAAEQAAADEAQSSKQNDIFVEPAEESTAVIDAAEEPAVTHYKSDATQHGPPETTHMTTPPPESLSQPPVPANVPDAPPAAGLPTPAASVARSISPRSERAPASSSRHASIGRPEDVGRASESRYDALPAPKPRAINQIIQNEMPSAPSPPVGRARPRHVPAFDTDDDDDSDSALVRPRRHFRGGEDSSRDMSRGSMPGQGYPPEPTHHRNGFASRVPADPEYSNRPPPQPPGYHPGYYPPTAPPYYSNHSHGMSQSNYPHPSPYGPSSHSSSSPYTDTWNYSPGYPHSSNPPQRHDTLVPRDYPHGLSPLRTGSGLEDDPSEVFGRISQAIPDLHVLLARYKETHRELSVREDLLRRAGIEQEEKLRAKDNEITDLKERSRNLENKYSTEASRLRMQIGNLEEQARELQEQRRETEKYKKEALDTKTALDSAMKSWESRFKELEEAHLGLQAASAEDKARSLQDFEEWKSTTNTRNDAEKIALAIQFDKRLKEASVEADNILQATAAQHVQEKDDLRSDHQRQQLERQDSFERVRGELESKLAIVQKDHEEALKRERQSREVWLAEREALIKSHQDDRDSQRKSWDEQRDLLDAQHKKGKDESDKAWIELHADASRRADDEKAKTDQLVKEKEELQKKYNELRADAEKEKNVIRSVAANLESEKSRLEKLMECYGDIAEIKSKGDTY